MFDWSKLMEDHASIILYIHYADSISSMNIIRRFLLVYSLLVTFFFKPSLTHCIIVLYFYHRNVVDRQG